MADEKINKRLLNENQKQSGFLSKIVTKLSVNNSEKQTDLSEFLENDTKFYIQGENILQQSKASVFALGNIETGIEKVYKGLLNSLDFQKKLAADEALDKKEDAAEAAKRAKSPDQKIKTERRDDDDESKWLGFGNLLAIAFSTKLSDILKISKFTPALNFIKNLPKLILFTVPKKLFDGLIFVKDFILKSFRTLSQSVFKRLPEFIQKIFGRINTRIVKLVNWFKSFGVLFNTVKTGAVEVTKNLLTKLNPKNWGIGKIFAPILNLGKSIKDATGSISKIFKPITDILSKLKIFIGNSSLGRFLSSAGNFLKSFGMVFKVLGKLFVPLTILFATVKGVLGGIEGWTKTNGSIFEKLWNSMEGLVKGVVDVLIGWIPGAISWIADKLGFKQVAQFFGNIDLNDWLNPFKVLKDAWNLVTETWNLFTRDMMGYLKSFANLKIMEAGDPMRAIVRMVVPDPTENTSKTSPGYWALKAIPDEIIEYAWGKKLAEEEVGMKATARSSRKKIVQLRQQQEIVTQKVESGELTKEEGKELSDLIEQRRRLEIQRKQIVTNELELNRLRNDEMDDLFVDKARLKELETLEKGTIKSRRAIETKQKEIDKKLQLLEKPPAIPAEALTKPLSTEEAMVGNKLADSSGYAALLAPATNIINNHAGNTVTNTSQNINNNIAESTDNILSGSAYAY